MREKLIELLREIDGRIVVFAGMSFDEQKESCYSQIADNLIANDVTVQKHGKWIEKFHEDNDWRYMLYHCSECDTACAKKRNFCSYCGAKMDLED